LGFPQRFPIGYGKLRAPPLKNVKKPLKSADFVSKTSFFMENCMETVENFHRVSPMENSKLPKIGSQKTKKHFVVIHKNHKKVSVARTREHRFGDL